MSERFWSKVNKTESCWLWEAYVTQAGYGQTHFEGKLQYAHRVAYSLTKGNIPKDMTIDHLCKTRACVNPAHLEVVTRGENTLRGNSPAAINRLKTMCKRGHPLTPDNIYVWRKMRGCRQCKNIRQRAYRSNEVHTWR